MTDLLIIVYFATVALSERRNPSWSRLSLPRHQALVNEDEDDEEETQPNEDIEQPASSSSSKDKTTDPSKDEDPSLFSFEFFYTYYRAYMLLDDEIWIAVVLAIANIFLSIAQLAEPVLFGQVINQLTQLNNSENHMWAQLFPLLIAWSSFSLFGAVASIFIGLFADQLAHRHRHLVYQSSYLHALVKTPLASKDTDAGKIKKIMDEGRDALFWNWLSVLRSELVALLALVILIPLSFFLNPYMAISIVVLCLVFAATTNYVSSQAAGLQRSINNHYQEEGALITDVLSNLALIQSYDIVQEEVQRLRVTGDKILAAQYPVLKFWAGVVSINQCATSLSILCVVLQGAILYSHNLITVGEIVTFIQFVSMVVTRLGQVVQSVQRLTRDVSKLKSFFAILDSEPAITESSGPIDVDRLKGTVQFHNVSFTYDGKIEPAVHSVNFTIEAGKSLALVGSSGAGKTTTLSLLYRAFDPLSGHITIDGHDITTMSVASLRRNIATVFQETLVLNRTIKENLMVGKLTATDDELRLAADQAQALSFIDASKEGFDLNIGERGRGISGGERQRLSIARAVLRDAPILILDEATSALDSHTETLLALALDNLKSQRTTLIIAHRLSTIRNADHILVMDKGRVVEAGTFDELYQQQGIFTKLVEEQYSWKPPTPTPTPIASSCLSTPPPPLPLSSTSTSTSNTLPTSDQSPHTTTTEQILPPSSPKAQ